MCRTSLLAMFPEFRSGKINTFARPPSLPSGSLRAAISGIARTRPFQALTAPSSVTPSVTPLAEPSAPPEE